MVCSQTQNLKPKTFNKAFTLIELLLVLLLLGIGLIGVVPNLIKKAVSPDPIETFFNEIIGKAYLEAKNTSRPVYIKGFKSSPNILTFDNKRILIPDAKAVLSAKINGENTTGIEYHIAVYPQGICDEFRIEFEDGEIVESIPLIMKAVHK